MVARILILLLLLPCVAAAQKRSGCLSCHPPHYAEINTCTGCHNGISGTVRKDLAHTGLIPPNFARFTIPGSEEVARGRRLVEKYGCRRCHTIGGRGNSFATNLDKLQNRVGERIGALREPAIYMPDFRFADREVIDLLNYQYFEAGKKGAARTKVEVPLVVHFQEEEKAGTFAKKCGPCHKALTEKWGGVGIGEIGPNLSGLLSIYYPPTFGGGRRWSEKRLRDWLKNPRHLRPLTSMQPVSLTRHEFDLLVRELLVSKTGAR